MLDDIRDHDPTPTDEERDAMDTDPLLAFSRALIIGGIAMLVGVAASYLFGNEAQPEAAPLHVSQQQR